jgi:type I site-specific restriction-modification system R (restriction) subunit
VVQPALAGRAAARPPRSDREEPTCPPPTPSAATNGTTCPETAIRGTCAHDQLLDLIENFTAFLERPGGLIKAVARNHQLLDVNSAIENLHRVRAAGE